MLASRVEADSIAIESGEQEVGASIEATFALKLN